MQLPGGGGERQAGGGNLRRVNLALEVHDLLLDRRDNLAGHGGHAAATHHANGATIAEERGVSRALLDPRVAKSQ